MIDETHPGRNRDGFRRVARSTQTLGMLLWLMLALPLWAYPPAPASQAAVNAGTEPYLYVTPATMKGAVAVMAPAQIAAANQYGYQSLGNVVLPRDLTNTLLAATVYGSSSQASCYVHTPLGSNYIFAAASGNTLRSALYKIDPNSMALIAELDTPSIPHNGQAGWNALVYSRMQDTVYIIGGSNLTCTTITSVNPYTLATNIVVNQYGAPLSTPNSANIACDETYLYSMESFSSALTNSSEQYVGTWICRYPLSNPSSGGPWFQFPGNAASGVGNCLKYDNGQLWWGTFTYPGAIGTVQTNGTGFQDTQLTNLAGIFWSTNFTPVANDIAIAPDRVYYGLETATGLTNTTPTFFWVSKTNLTVQTFITVSNMITAPYGLAGGNGVGGSPGADDCWGLNWDGDSLWTVWNTGPSAQILRYIPANSIFDVYTFNTNYQGCNKVFTDGNGRMFFSMWNGNPLMWGRFNAATIPSATYYTGNVLGALNSSSVTWLTNSTLLAQTAVGTLWAYTVPAGVTNTYLVGGMLNVKSLTTDQVQMRVQFTDENNAAQNDGIGAIATSTGYNSYAEQTITAKGGTTITLVTTNTTGLGSENFNANGHLRSVQ